MKGVLRIARLKATGSSAKALGCNLGSSRVYMSQMPPKILNGHAAGTACGQTKTYRFSLTTSNTMVLMVARLPLNRPSEMRSAKACWKFCTNPNATHVMPVGEAIISASHHVKWQCPVGNDKNTQGQAHAFVATHTGLLCP